MSQFGQRRVESCQNRVETRFWSQKTLSGRVRGQQNCVRTLRRREMKIQNWVRTIRQWVRTIPRGFEPFSEGFKRSSEGLERPPEGLERFPEAFERYLGGFERYRRGLERFLEGFERYRGGLERFPKGWNDTEKGSNDSGGDRTIPERFEGFARRWMLAQKCETEGARESLLPSAF